jgi:MFS family permease
LHHCGVRYHAALFLLILGIAVGLSGPVKSALMAELYGIERLGAVRSLFTMVMVLSTALGPMIVGNMMDMGYSIFQIVLSLAILAFITLLNGFRLKS